MKKSLSRVIIVLVFCLIPSIVNAASACSYSEQARLNETAGNVKVSYTTEERDEYYEDAINTDIADDEDDHMLKEYYMNINIINVDDSIYITTTNKVTGETKTYYNTDASDGIISFEHSDVYKITEYEIGVYSNNSNCKGELIRKINMILPKINEYYFNSACDDNPEYSLCQQYVTREFTDDEFVLGLQNYENEHTEEEAEEIEKENKIMKFYKDHALVINITAGVIVVAGVTTAVILIKRKRSRVL